MPSGSGWAQLFRYSSLWDIVSVCMVVIVLFVLVDTASTFQSYEKIVKKSNLAMTDERMRIYITSTLMIGILVWPIVWNLLVHKKGVCGGDRMAAAPRLTLAFFWPVLMLLIDLQQARKRKRDPTFFESLQRIGYLKSDANTIITASFAIGTLLVSLKKHDKAEGANLVMYALLLCVAFVMPTSETPATSRIAIIIRASQKVCLSYAVGFIIAGIVTDLVQI